MGTFVVQGGKPLKGKVTPHFARNEALQIFCAVLLTPEKVTIKNIPEYNSH
jgi:UDP-N-acetylglucosamine 1-carboxyvinyltransferase